MAWKVDAERRVTSLHNWRVTVLSLFTVASLADTKMCWCLCMWQACSCLAPSWSGWMGSSDNPAGRPPHGAFTWHTQLPSALYHCWGPLPPAWAGQWKNRSSYLLKCPNAQLLGNEMSPPPELKDPILFATSSLEKEGFRRGREFVVANPALLRWWILFSYWSRVGESQFFKKIPQSSLCR